MRTTRIKNSVIFAALLTLFGCAHTQSTELTSKVSTSDGEITNIPYRIHAGDQLDIKFFYNPELNETVTVRPDGIISLQLVDEVKAAGLAPSELDDLLTKKYSLELKKPDITVIVRSFTGQRIYVGGEVNQQGLYTMTGSFTALQAAMQAGGFRPTAQPSETVVIRKGPDRKPVLIRVDLESVTLGAEGGNDFTLQSEDIVFVPKSPIAKANQFVNQYVEQLFLFRGVSFGFVYNIND